ncbi:hypothetical protein LJC63_10470 [Ruminococcaceae bacterium OttesenSCG-928-L11]|nr:hypothetical protein [Ruminococcaceae bacterium OttesenSCG-928-L11]
MSNLQLIKRLYRGKTCYSDALSAEELSMLQLPSGADEIVEQMINEGRIVFLTGNPGDGKTFIIRKEKQKRPDLYTISDLNSVADEQMDGEIKQLLSCYHNHQPCIIAANEYPLLTLLRKLAAIAPDFHKELLGVKQNTIILNYPTVQLGRICVVDLNDRNLLDKERSIVKLTVDKFAMLLKDSLGSNAHLDYNIRALSDSLVLQQYIRIFSLISLTGEHYAIRDILGTIAYTFTACTLDEINSGASFYYDAIFSGDNELMRVASSFDPIRLSKPSLDEMLWNGELLDGWRLGIPKKWPHEIEAEVEQAVDLFKSIKRKFYFENELSKDLDDLQPVDYSECEKILISINSKNKEVKRRLIRSMNKLFLSSDMDNERLRVWTTHGFDLSRESGAAVSTRYIDGSDLELIFPEPVKWLSKLEYTPSYIVLRNKRSTHRNAGLQIDLDMLKALIAIEKGYPVALLSTQYEQKLNQFLHGLCSAGLAKDYSSGEVLLSNRREGTSKRIIIEDDKYELSLGGVL